MSELEHDEHGAELDAGEREEDRDPAARPASPGGGRARAGIKLGDRVLAVGNTGEGKSELLAHLFAIHTGQRLLVDVQDHYELGPAALAEKPAPLEVDSVRDIDWRHRTIRYVPRTLSKREFDDLYAAIYQRGRVLVWLDEAEDAAPSSGPPQWVKKTVKQGRKRYITHLAATQRPHGVDRSIINQSEHAFLFLMVDSDDIDALSYRVPGCSARELAGDIAGLGKHEYFAHTLGDRQLVHMPPLPASLIEATRRHVVNPR